jgi:colanic acid/amylovoran biosynthesis glycosyltransferase
MRVAFVVGSFPALSETFVLDQVTGLIDRGHDVVIFGRAPATGAAFPATLQSYQLSDRTERLPSSRREHLGMAGRTARLLVSAPRTSLSVLTRSCNVIEYGRLAASGKLWSYASKFLEGPRHFEVVLAHFGTNGLLAQRLREVGALHGPLVTVFHGNDLSSELRTRGAGVYQPLFDHGELMLPVSEYFRERLLTLGCRPERTLVQHMGVNIDQFQLCQAATDRSNARVRIVSVCRLVEKKGIAFGLQALANALARSKVAIEWLIVGDGPLRAHLGDVAAQLGLAHAVRWCGARSRVEVKELLAGADIFLAPSVTARDGDEEGIPVAIMEAAASGLPIVSTLHAGIPELVRHGTSGYLAPEWDAPAMADHILDLAANPAKRKTMGQAGRKVVAEHYNLHALNDQLESILRGVVEASHSSLRSA